MKTAEIVDRVMTNKDATIERLRDENARLRRLLIRSHMHLPRDSEIRSAVEAERPWSNL